MLLIGPKVDAVRSWEAEAVRQEDTIFYGWSKKSIRRRAITDWKGRRANPRWQRVPDGHVVVLVEPTEEMIEAAGRGLMIESHLLFNYRLAARIHDSLMVHHDRSRQGRCMSEPDLMSEICITASDMITKDDV